MLFSTHIDASPRRNSEMDKKIEKKLRALFKRSKVLKLEQIMEVIGERSTRTVFRCLKQLDYISSYTHTRSYYTLKEIATFNQEGFWHYGQIGFSVHGSLKDMGAFFGKGTSW